MQLDISSVRMLASRLIPWGYCLIAFTLPLVRAHWHSKLIILLAILIAIHCRPFQFWSSFRRNWTIYLFLSLFLFDVFGLTHSENINYGLRYIETKLPVLIFPILILASQQILIDSLVNKIFKFFLFGVLATLFGYILIVINYSINNGFDIKYWFSDRISNIPAMTEQEWINIHPSFLSLYISFSIFFLVGHILSVRKITIRIINILGLIVLVFFQVWLNSRAGLIGFGLGLLFYIFYQFNNKYRVIALLISFGFIAIIFATTFSKERLIYAPLRALDHVGEVNVNDQLSWPISFRMQITNCSISILQNGRWIMGYGTGDFRDQINACFIQNDYGWLMARDFDAHSEYFSQIHRHGILGLILFMFCLIYPFVKAVQTKDLLYAIFILLLAVSAIPETILSSQKGVVFYAFLNSLLYIRSRQFVSN